MNRQMYVIHDTASGVFDLPFCMRSEAEAIRAFTDACVSADGMIGKHPEHFQLFYVGAYDDNTGKIDSVAPRHVANGIELVAKARRIEPGSLKANGDLPTEDVELPSQIGLGS